MNPAGAMPITVTGFRASSIDFPDDRRIAGKARLPQRITQHDIRNATLARFFSGQKETAEHRLDAEYIEIIRGYVRHINALRSRTAGERQPVVMVGKHSAEASVAVAQIAVVKVGKRRSGA